MARVDAKRICAALAHTGSTLHSCTLLCAIAEGESLCGDAPDLPGNWGAIQKRACTPAEKATIAAGRFPPPTATDEQLHGDTSPTAGAYEVWFYKFCQPDGHTPDDVAAAKRLVYELETVRGIRDWRDLGTADLAARMYDAKYYQGASTDRATCISAYTEMLDRGYAAFGVGVPSDWTASASESFAFVARDGETLRDRIVRCCDEAGALGHMSDTSHPTRYSTFVRASVDVTAGLEHVRTSCAVVQRAIDDHCGRRAARSWPSLVGGGMFGGWLGDLSYTHPAWVRNDGKAQPRAGDLFYVAASPSSNNNHVGRFIRELSSGHWATFEGGGGSGTETGATTRTMGAGFSTGRLLIGWWDADRMGYV
jgi:hypothetical protein